MRRREFITLLGGTAAAWPLAAWPLAARAQQSERVRRIAMVMSLDENDPLLPARTALFARALRERGWIEDRNIRIDYRLVPTAPDRVQALAAELVSLAPDLIVANSTTP